jgi:monoamine oxidase
MNQNDITRRRLIGTGAAAGAGALLTGVPAADAKKKPKKKPKHRRKIHKADVVVVGAGFAGLSAARAVMQAGKSVYVVEARDRVGGRVFQHELGAGVWSEAGGTFVGPTQNRILALMKDYGVDTFDTYDPDGSNNVYYSTSGQRTEWSDSGPTGTAPPDPAITPDLATVVTQLDQMSTTVPVDAPWEAPNAATWDGQTLETWIKGNTVNPDFINLSNLATRPIFGAESRELSLLFVLFYIASSGDETHPGTFERNFDTREGGQMWRMQGGSQHLAFMVAADLQHRIFLNRPVRRIVQAKTLLRVETDKGNVYGKRVIVAVPPTLAGRIDYEPILPFQRDQLTQRLGMGALTKVAAVYDKPFWRDKGYNGTGLDAAGLVTATFDDSPPDASKGIIFGFVGGDKCRQYAKLGEDDRKQQVLQEFAKFWGDDALKPTDFFETTWANEQWTRGCPVGIAGPGVLFAYGDQIRAPVDRIHWAGTETSTYWNGYMDGAVRSGERAASEVLAEL